MPTLDYRVPPGQDPAAILTALRMEDLDGSPDPHDSHLVHVDCAGEVDRDRVRAVIGSVRTSAIDAGVSYDPGEIRFEDEAEGGRA